MKNIFLKLFPTILLLVFSFQFAQAQTKIFEGVLDIKTVYKKTAKDTSTSTNNFKLFMKGNKAMIDHKEFGKMVMNTENQILHVIVGQGSQPVIWKVNIATLNQLGGLLMLMKAATGQDVMNITPQTKLTATTASATLSGYKTIKYNTYDETHTGNIWVVNDFPHNMTGLWTALNITPALNSANIKNGMILKAESKSNKTGETNTMTITPKAQAVEDKMFELPAGGQILDVTPMLVQMMQNQKPEDVQKMLLQMMPKK